MTKKNKPNIKVDLESVIRTNFESFKNGDFSMLTDEETKAFYRYINTFLLRYKNVFSYNEQQDLIHEIFQHMIQSKMFNLDINKETKPTTYLGILIDTKIKTIIRDRTMDKRKIHYNGKLLSYDYLIRKDSDNTETPLINLIPFDDYDPNKEFIESTSNKYRQCSEKAIKQNTILYDIYVKNKKIEDIAIEQKKSYDNMRKWILNAKNQVKIDLAEEGFFDNKRHNVHEDYDLEYTRKIISEKGVSYVNMVDEVPTSVIADYLNIEEESIISKTVTDKKKLQDKLELLTSINESGKKGKLIKKVIFAILNTSKNIDSLPDKYFEVINNLLIEDKILGQICNYHTKFKQVYIKNGYTNDEIDEIIDDHIELAKKSFREKTNRASNTSISTNTIKTKTLI